MSTINVNLAVSTPSTDALAKSLGRDGRTSLNTAAAYSLWASARAHLRDYAGTHHKTADGIKGGPATRTGHLEEAAETMSWEAGADVARVTVRSPGFGRVFREIRITPKTASALTVPIHAMAYGRRVAEVRRSTTVFRPKGTNILATTDKQGDLVPLYALVRAVTLPQDRAMLPTDADMRKAAARGMLEEIRKVRKAAAI